MKKLQFAVILACLTLLTPCTSQAFGFSKKSQEKSTINGVINTMHKDLGKVSDALRKAQDKLEHEGLDDAEMGKLRELQNKVAHLNREAGKILTEMTHDL